MKIFHCGSQTGHTAVLFSGDTGGDTGFRKGGGVLVTVKY